MSDSHLQEINRARERVLVGQNERDMRPPLVHEVLADLGLETHNAGTYFEFLDRCGSLAPDLLIIDADMPQDDGFVGLQQVYRQRPLPIVVLSACHDSTSVLCACRAHALAYVVKPYRGEELKVAITLARFQFKQWQTLCQELTETRQALKDRKLIERAQGAIMRRLAVDTQEAMRRLQKLASDQNRKLLDVAREILRADEVFAPMDVIPATVARPRHRVRRRRELLGALPQTTTGDLPKCPDELT
jgi:response regulator NasT